MRKKIYLLTTLILFVFIMGVSGAPNKEEKIHTPDYYEVNARAMFKNEQWDEGKKLLDESMKYYPYVSGLNELMGRYFYQYKQDYDKARYFLVRAVRNNPENVTAKQMLVNLEDKTGNYSSAICYVNELLEINPYWQGLWKKKIGLYRKQGNNIEADRLLKRLYQIYPNDSLVKKDYAYSLEENYIRLRNSGNIDGAISSLYDLIDTVKDNEGYYMALVNLLLQQGNIEEALKVTSKGISNIPNNSNLIIKRAGILAEEGRYQEAITFLQSCMRYNKSTNLVRFNNQLLAEAANAAKLNDPYVLYGRLYEMNKSNEALDYLINTSILRGYDEDALYYISEAKRRRGEHISLLYKEYSVYKRMGNTSKSYSLLYTLAEMNPTDTSLADELALNLLSRADNLMKDGLYSEALPYLNAAIRKSHDPELKASVMGKAYSCNYELKCYEAAKEILDSMRIIFPNDSRYVIRKADILNCQDSTLLALNILDDALHNTTMTEMRPIYVSHYEEIAIPYIKNLIELGASGHAFDESVRLLKINPSSKEGLQYVMTTADMLERYDDYDYYATKAHAIYPKETVYVTKLASSYNRTEDYDRSIDMIRPWLNEYPDNQGLIGAFSESSEKKAYKLIKNRLTESALSVIDTALVFDKNNISLLYAKGMAYEAMKKYDSAHYYQSFYVPGITEVADFKRHLNGLQKKSYKNEIIAEYLQGRYGEEDIITGVATLAYKYNNEKNTYTGLINYAGRDGNTIISNDQENQIPGGQGVQVQAEWEHRFSPHWSVAGTIAWANKYFPKIMAGIRVTHEFKNDLTLDLHTNYKQITNYMQSFKTEEEQEYISNEWNMHNRSLINLGVGLLKTYDRFSVSGKVDGFLLSSKPYFNASTQLKYFMLDDGHTNVSITGGLGSAPEVDMIDNAMPAIFDKLNTMVGLGGAYLLNKHLSLGILGTWYTFYSQSEQQNEINNDNKYIETKYKNLYNVQVQLHIYF